MREHRLKTHPPYFGEVLAGEKTVEVRRDDRGGFAVGDVLLLLEYAPGAPGVYTGRECRRTVTHVLRGWGIEPGFVALSIRP